MKHNSTLRVKTFVALLIFVAGLLTSINSTAQITTPCSNPSQYIYGLTGNGEIYEINMANGNTGTVIKNNTYSGNSPSKANGMGYNYVNKKFYYFKRNVGTSPQEFVSFEPTTNTVSMLASPSSCADEVHTGCVNYTGTGYYTIDIQGNLNYYNILTNTWTFITSNIVDQYNLDVDSCIRVQNAGDMAMDGYGHIFLVTSSNSNFGLFKFPIPLPTSATAKITVTRIVAPTSATPTGQSFAGIAFNPSGQIYMATKTGNKLYRLEDNLSLTSIGTMPTNDVGNDLTSCSFPYLVLPVYWKSFDATLQKSNTVSLSWEVGEQQNKGFYVQHSLDGKTWEDLSFIPSKGNSETAQSYYYTHATGLNGTHLYRIRQVNIDGKESFSDIKSVVIKNDSQPVSIWPNPTTDVVRISGSNKSLSNAKVFDLSGRMITQKQLQAESVNSINIGNLPKGTYIIKIESTDGTSYNQKISKQ